jgi:transposase
MRKGFDGLGNLVRLRHDIFEGDLFVFVGRRKDRCKILFWERGGFVLYYKRLERACFKLPATEDHEVVMSGGDLAMLLDGIDFSKVQKSILWKPPKNVEENARKGIDKQIAL